MNRLHQNHTYSPDEAAGIVVACNRIIVINALFVSSVNNSNDKDIFSRFNNLCASVLGMEQCASCVVHHMSPPDFEPVIGWLSVS